ncbi:MAG: Lrp/AsnC family transcriptional regulator [Desulfobacterales bacterium]|nr:Lrp/AsnC family transcriptional regulator [Desulfobacterales bacterium]MBF0398707.1 Lrp/AsnC family transcriptional regulator [Desulfobacterales bacterium]
MIDELEKRIIASIQDDIPITERPYMEIASKLNISEDLLLEKLKDLIERGIIRRFGATIRHQKSGYKANAMVAWEVDENSINEIGKKMASFKQVSHCYHRIPTPEWSYNLYTMIHAKTESACRKIAVKMAKEMSLDKYMLLFSKRELKKSSMQYFTPE